MNNKINKFISIFLSIVLSFTLFFGFILLIIKENITMDIVNEILRESVFANVETYDDSNVEYMALNYNDVDDLIENSGFDKKIINEILNNEEFKDAISDYKDEITDYLIGKNDNLNIDSETLNKAVNKAIDEYESRTGKVVDRSGISSEIDKLIEQVNSSLSFVKENKLVSTVTNVIFGTTVIYVLIILNAVLIVAIALVNMSITKMLKYISIPFMVVGCLLLLIGLFIGFVEIDFLNTVINNLGNSFKLYGFIDLLVGIIALVIGSIFKTNNEYSL